MEPQIQNEAPTNNFSYRKIKFQKKSKKIKFR
jgi:hypothetical protein